VNAPPEIANQRATAVPEKHDTAEVQSELKTGPSERQAPLTAEADRWRVTA
jgi:hypothetical protein